MKNVINLFLGCFLLGLVACYDDKGNYDYVDINEVSISLPNYSVRLDKTDTVSVFLEPVIEQTMEEGEANLSFKWEKITDLLYGSYEECGNERNLSLAFAPEDRSSVRVRLTVTDNRPDGSDWIVESTVSPIEPYSKTWFVLQNEDGKSVLGVVDGIGEEAVVVPNAYYEDQGKDFPLLGTPKMLKSYLAYGDWLGGFLNPSKIMLMVMTDQDVGLYDASSFNLLYDMRSLLYYKEANGQSNYVPQEMWSVAGIGDLFVNDEKEVYLANGDGFSVFHPLKWQNAHEEREVHITHAAWINIRSGESWFLYDAVGHCFLRCLGQQDMRELMMTNQYFRFGMTNYFSPTQTYDKLTYLQDNPARPNVFDPNIGDDKIVISMNSGAQGSKVFATAYSQSSGKYVVYEMNGYGYTDPGNVAVCSGVYEFELPGANYNDVQVAMSSYGYEQGIVFVSSGNKVWKVELALVPRVTLLYEHPNANAKIVKLKFKYEENDRGYFEDPSDYESYISYQYYWCLGALVDYGDNTGGVVDMKLTAAGEIDRDEPVIEHTGFGKVIDFAFVSRD